MYLFTAVVLAGLLNGSSALSRQQGVTRPAISSPPVETRPAPAANVSPPAAVVPAANVPANATPVAGEPATATPVVNASHLSTAASVPGVNIPAGYVITSEDSVQVSVWKEPNLSGTLLVRPDGMVTLPLIGEVMAAGTTPTALGQELATKFKKYVSDPLVTVTVLKVSSKQIFMLGEVGHVGPLTLTPDLTPLQAISAAGGLSPYAHPKKIYILRGAANNKQKIPFDYKKAVKDGNQQGVSLLPGDTIVVP